MSDETWEQRLEREANEAMENLVGLTVTAVEVVADDDIHIVSEAGVLRMYHSQDCCEHVRLEDVAGGELNDLVGQTVLDMWVSSREGDSQWGDTCTWTFYTIRTNTHTLTLRFLGESNGYYSESVEVAWEATR